MSNMANVPTSAIMSQMTHLSNYINKRIDLLDSDLQKVNDKLEILTSRLDQVIQNSTSDDPTSAAIKHTKLASSTALQSSVSQSANNLRLVEVFNKHINNLTKELHHLASSASASSSTAPAAIPSSLSSPGSNAIPSNSHTLTHHAVPLSITNTSSNSEGTNTPTNTNANTTGGGGPDSNAPVPNFNDPANSAALLSNSSPTSSVQPPPPSHQQHQHRQQHQQQQSPSHQYHQSPQSVSSQPQDQTSNQNQNQNQSQNQNQHHHQHLHHLNQQSPGQHQQDNLQQHPHQQHHQQQQLASQQPQNQNLATNQSSNAINYEFSRPWSKALSLRSPAPQPNSAPSSPFMSNRFTFDFNTFPIERSASFSKGVPLNSQADNSLTNASNLQNFQSTQPLLQQQNDHQHHHHHHHHQHQHQQDLVLPAGITTGSNNISKKGSRLLKNTKTPSLPINSSNPYILSLASSNLLAGDAATSPTTNPTDASSATNTPDPTNSNSAAVAAAAASAVAANSASLGPVYQLNNFDNDPDHGMVDISSGGSLGSTMRHDMHDLQSIDTIHQDQSIGTPKQSDPSLQQTKKRRRNSVKVISGATPVKVGKQSKQATPQLTQAIQKTPTTGSKTINSASSTPTAASTNTIPGSIVLPNKKFNNVPQYKLEKSLKTVHEIWQEYEYGLNDKPPLKQLEEKYNTKWRNETESRTFLRRKKIYEAIEIGKEKGYDENAIVEELEQLRTYTYFDHVKKRPLQWLYSNIPPKYSGE